MVLKYFTDLKWNIYRVEMEQSFTGQHNILQHFEPLKIAEKKLSNTQTGKTNASKSAPKCIFIRPLTTFSLFHKVGFLTMKKLAYPPNAKYTLGRPVQKKAMPVDS